jgi:hypothetical protein
MPRAASNSRRDASKSTYPAAVGMLATAGTSGTVFTQTPFGKPATAAMPATQQERYSKTEAWTLV